MPEIDWTLRGEVEEREDFEGVDRVDCEPNVSEYTDMVNGHTCYVERGGELLGEVDVDSYDLDDVDIHTQMTGGVMIAKFDRDSECTFESYHVTEPGAHGNHPMSKLVCE